MTVINFTLVIQAINFFIAFLLIKFFFFKTAVDHIQSEETLQKTLNAKVGNYQELVNSQEQKLKNQWHNMVRHFSFNSPSLKPKPFFVQKLSPRSLPEIDPEARTQEITQLTKELINKVNHVG